MRRAAHLTGVEPVASIAAGGAWSGCAGATVCLPTALTLHSAPRHPAPRRYTRGTGGAVLPGDAPFSGQPFHLVFNLAVGGVHVGADRAACLETLKTPKYMMVDWVRVYTKK